MSCKIKEIYDYLDSLWPFANMPDFDNSGFLVGDIEARISCAALSVDPTPENITAAGKLGAGLLITHHPIIFNPLRSLPCSDPAYTAAREGVAVLSLHIPVDVSVDGANPVLAQKLGFVNAAPFRAGPGAAGSEICDGTECVLETPAGVRQLAENASERLGTPALYCDAGRPVKRVLLCGGSAGHLCAAAADAGFDCLLCGELKHSDVIYLRSRGVSAVLATHFATEKHIPALICEKLSERFRGVRFTVLPEENPLRAV